MKITSHHLMISSLVFRTNLRLIPLLLLLFLGSTRGMPHVLRFGKDLLTVLDVDRMFERDARPCIFISFHFISFHFFLYTPPPSPSPTLIPRNDVHDARGEIETFARALAVFV